jgi:hypothetical protein
VKVQFKIFSFTPSSLKIMLSTTSLSLSLTHFFSHSPGSDEYPSPYLRDDEQPAEIFLSHPQSFFVLRWGHFLLLLLILTQFIVSSNKMFSLKNGK